MTNKELSQCLKEWWELYFHEVNCSEKYLKDTLEKHRQAYLKLQSLLEAQGPMEEERKDWEKELDRLIWQEIKKDWSDRTAIFNNVYPLVVTFIRSLILAKPKVTKEFVERWARKQIEYFVGREPQHQEAIDAASDQIEEMLQEAGVEVEE